MRTYLPILGVVCLLALPLRLPACPYCQEAATAACAEEDDPLREARALNHSIYFMVCMPYLLLGFIGFRVYRAMKAADRRVQILPPANGAS